MLDSIQMYRLITLIVIHCTLFKSIQYSNKDDFAQDKKFLASRKLSEKCIIEIWSLRSDQNKEKCSFIVLGIKREHYVPYFAKIKKSVNILDLHFP